MQAYANTLTSRIGSYADQYKKDQFGLPELFSKGLSDINDVVSNTVSEIRVCGSCVVEALALYSQTSLVTTPDMLNSETSLSYNRAHHHQKLRFPTNM